MKIGLNINRLDLIEYHYNKIRELKRFFINNSGVQRYEGYKIWASWLITHRSNTVQPDSFLPSINIADDVQIINNLKEKGAHATEACSFYQTFVKRCIDLVEDFKNVCNLPKLNTINEDVVQIDDNTDYHGMITIKYGSVKHKISVSLLDKFRRLYMNSRTMANFEKNLFVMLNHYNLLDGLSFQWSVPENVYKILDDNLDIKGELFASPLNCLSNKFWSLFEIDRLFSSYGDFFKSGLQDFYTGVYQVNPPFIESIFINSSLKILDYLNSAKEKREPLTFIYFMPNWLDSCGYQQLKGSQFLIDEFILNGGNHSYYESNEGKYVKVHFNTHILLLSSNNEIRKLWTQQLKNKIKNSFLLN